MSWLLPQLRPNFTAALRDKEAKTVRSRIAAAERLSEPDAGYEDQAIEALFVLASDENAQARRNAVRSLGRIGRASALRKLADCLQDEDSEVRELAVIAISEIDTQEAHTLLRGALTSSYPEVRFQAAQCCVERCPEEIKERIVELTRDPDPKARAVAVSVLGSIPHPRSRRVLLGAIEDPDEEVRVEAALALAKLGEARAASVLRAALDDPAMVFEALQGLTSLNDTDSADRIAGLTQGMFKPLIVKAAAARALVVLGDPRGVEALREVLTGWRWEGRSLAVEITGELGIVELVKELKNLAKRLRGTDPEALARTLADLAPKSQEALEALRILSERTGELGEKARAELSRLASSGFPVP